MAQFMVKLTAPASSDGSIIVEAESAEEAQELAKERKGRIIWSSSPDLSSVDVTEVRKLGSE